MLYSGAKGTMTPSNPQRTALPRRRRTGTLGFSHFTQHMFYNLMEKTR